MRWQSAARAWIRSVSRIGIRFTAERLISPDSRPVACLKCYDVRANRLGWEG